jgi:hypothetical protein
MDYLRVMLVGGAIVGTLCALFSLFVYDSFFVVIAASAWTAHGYTRVFGKHVGATTFALALKGVLMSIAWPLMPPRR